MTPDENRIFYRRMFELALPIGLQHLMLASVAAADAMMLGRVAQAEMTAVSMATQIQFIQNVFLYAVTTAGAILGAQYYGKGDRETLRDLFHLMLRYGGLVSIIFFISCESLLPLKKPVIYPITLFCSSGLRSSIYSCCSIVSSSIYWAIR